MGSESGSWRSCPLAESQPARLCIWVRRVLDFVAAAALARWLITLAVRPSTLHTSQAEEMKSVQIDLVTRVGEQGLWYRIDGEAKKRVMAGGIYRVHAGGGPDDGFQPVPRLLKPDPLGRLYIGRAGVFTGRFIELMKALNPNLLSEAHGFARSHASMAAVVSRFPLDSLRFTLRFSENPTQSEAEELKAYRAEFGELPPFNGALPGDPSST